MWSVGFGCTSGEDFSKSHWRVSIKEVNITLFCEGLTSASLSLYPGISGEAGTRLVCMARHTQLSCAEGQDVHLDLPEMAPEGFKNMSTSLTVLLFRHYAKEAKYHQG